MNIESVLRRKVFLRRWEIRDDLGFSDEEISKLVRYRVLKPVYFCKTARPKTKGKGKPHAYFVREQVVTALRLRVERA